MNGKNSNIIVKPIITVFGIMALFFITACSNKSICTESKMEDCSTSYTGNLLKNPSFEDSTETSAAFWTKGSGRWFKAPQEYQGDYQDKLYVAGNGHTGEKCLAIIGTRAGMARWYTQNVYLIEGTKYHFSCWIKTAWPHVAGRILIHGVGLDLYLEDTTIWTHVEKCFTASKTGSEAVFLMGQGLGTGFNGLGVIYFDDISIKKVK